MKKPLIKRDELREIIESAGIVRTEDPTLDLDFKDLMRFRISNILLVSSRYDFYTLVDDGQLTEAIFSEYVDLNLHYAPHITRVYSGESALELIQDQTFDLVITMSRLGNMDLKFFCSAVKRIDPDLPLVLLAYQSRELQILLDRGSLSMFDRVFIWSGDRKLFLAVIKIFEDIKNAPVDCAQFGVRAIILVEDSPQFYSSYLPLIYTELIKQGQALLEEGKNFSDKMLRQRARPKILHATSYEDAKRFYRHYKECLLGVITDLSFLQDGVETERAGLNFIRELREDSIDLPILVQTSQPEWEDRIRSYHVSFVDKGSRSLLQDVRAFMMDNFGFGDFVFHTPDGVEVDRASNLRELQQKLRTVPEESLLYHASRDQFSNWLMARTRFRLANQIKPVKIDRFTSTEELRAYIIRTIDQFMGQDSRGIITDFSPEVLDEHFTFLRIGTGSMGGKARGLAFIDTILKTYLQPEYIPEVQVTIPRTIVLCTEVFAEFVATNDLFDFVLEGPSDAHIVERFLAAPFPESYMENLRAIVAADPIPLAIRSSSLLEDTLYQPFAGIYATIMLPNCHPDVEVRLQHLMQAVRYVYASTYFHGARNYIEATGHRLEEEQMAIIIQQAAGQKHDQHFYPHYSGVARSHNYYPFASARPSDGVVDMALGLGKTIVDGGVCLQFCPAVPSVLPQFPDRKSFFSNSQHSFYAIDLHGDYEESMPSEDQYLRQLEIKDAEKHGTLQYLASTYSSENDALYEGVFREGPRILNFAPILQSEVLPLARVLRLLMQLCETAMNCPVEIEFAGVIHDGGTVTSDFSFLQVRPMVKEEGSFEIDMDAIPKEHILLQSESVLGNGVYRLHDIVYMKPEAFDPARTTIMAEEVDRINKTLRSLNRPYLLIGPGRWGSSDPWLGIPVKFPSISGAHAIVETSLPNMLPDPSQGSHFFQNLTSFRIAYFTTRHYRSADAIDWTWLQQQCIEQELVYTRHVHCTELVEIRVDGRTGRGIVLKQPADGMDGKE